MKKSNIRTFLFLLLTLLSIASYTYMYVASLKTNAPIKTSEIKAETPEIEAEKNIYLPDVVLIQKVFKTGKQVFDKAL